MHSCTSPGHIHLHGGVIFRPVTLPFQTTIVLTSWPRRYSPRHNAWRTHPRSPEPGHQSTPSTRHRLKQETYSTRHRLKQETDECRYVSDGILIRGGMSVLRPVHGWWGFISAITMIASIHFLSNEGKFGCISVLCATK